MSYEVSRKTVSATSCNKLTTSIANWLNECTNGDFALASTKTSSNFKHVYISYKGTKAGIGLVANPESNSAQYIYFHVASSITSSNGANVYPGSSQGTTSNSVEINRSRVTRNGTTYYEVDTVVCKLKSGYLVSFNGKCMYIGTYASPL